MTTDEAITGVVEKLRKEQENVHNLNLDDESMMAVPFMEIERILRTVLPPIIEAAQREGKIDGFVDGADAEWREGHSDYREVFPWSKAEALRRYGTKGG